MLTSVSQSCRKPQSMEPVLMPSCSKVVHQTHEKMKQKKKEEKDRRGKAERHEDPNRWEQQQLVELGSKAKTWIIPNATVCYNRPWGFAIWISSHDENQMPLALETLQPAAVLGFYSKCQMLAGHYFVDQACKFRQTCLITTTCQIPEKWPTMPYI